MRSKQALKNVIANLLLQTVTAVSGLLLPRFYLVAYGSAMNGMVSSVTQFMAYLMLVEAGISAASVVGLYGPLALHNENDINGVLAATQKFYIQSGTVYFFLVIILTIFYPLLVKNQISSFTTRGIIMILASSNLLDYIFLGKYRVLLTADQKGYVITLTQVLGTVVNTVICIILIQLNFSILPVKFIATIVFALRSIIIYVYIRQHYKYLNLKEKPKLQALDQHWSALIHQIAGVVLNNTNVIILTVCLKANSLLEVSVYTIYQMVANLINSVIGSFTSALSSGFGDVISRQDTQTLKEAYSVYEFIYNIILFTSYTCMGLLYIPFIKIYTNDITDANYIRPIIAILFTVIGILQNLRVPGLTIIIAAGHYEQTQWRAIKEAIINIMIAVLLVGPLGITGVLIGSAGAFLYSTVKVIFYVDKNILSGSLHKTLIRILRNIIVFLLFYFILVPNHLLASINTYSAWFIFATFLVVITGFCYTLINAVFEPDHFHRCIEKLKSIIFKS